MLASLLPAKLSTTLKTRTKTLPNAQAEKAALNFLAKDRRRAEAAETAAANE